MSERLEKARDAHRHSSKPMVALAQEIMRRTEPGKMDTTKPGEKPLVPWLIQSARSLAGSVISQADPND
jgi:hypothetical protein